jgi:hypothetical protein
MLMSRIFLSLFILLSARSGAQELYPYTEPASNMPSHSLSAKLSTMYGTGIHSDRLLQRYMPEVMLGLNKNWMLHFSATFSDMHEPKFDFESVRFYAKYRFLSNDDVHKHFRMAAFAALSYSRNHLDHNELSLMGDHSGAQLGIIATQLWNRFALSSTVGITEMVDDLRFQKRWPKEYAFEAANFSLSSGYLLLPKEYTDYKQTNLNLYVEFLGGLNLDWKYERYFVDVAPAVQLIFNSTSKLNIGGRFELSSDIYRLMKNSIMISYEHIFLNALDRKKKK